ncbi:hypothetical protein C5167_005761 [Papaver somniferum]|uniref:CW-type domain-containing protein n=1 Tax=Papaver somniferum TaxID=3469 RepID=A0A4Y7JBH3_PAPSO|nr:hypothetical protein C5167_005761 [Papaver somniferum]
MKPENYAGYENNDKRYDMRARSPKNYFAKKRKEEISNWIQCDRCEAWRRINRKFNARKLPDTWQCREFLYNGNCREPGHIMEGGERVISAVTDSRQLPKRRRRRMPSKKSARQLYKDYKKLLDTVIAFGSKLHRFTKFRVKRVKTPVKRKARKSPKVRRRLSSQQTASSKEDNLEGYSNQMPLVIRPYILKICDVPEDGHCGFHVVHRALTALGDKITGDPVNFVRRRMVATLQGNRGMFEEILKVWNVDDVDGLVRRLQPISNEAACGVGRWMRMPECGFLIAETFKCAVHYFSPVVRYTFVPSRSGLQIGSYRCITMGHVNHNNFISLKLKVGSPLPPSPSDLPCWKYVRSDFSFEWYAPIQKQIDSWAITEASMGYHCEEVPLENESSCTRSGNHANDVGSNGAELASHLSAEHDQEELDSENDVSTRAVIGDDNNVRSAVTTISPHLRESQLRDRSQFNGRVLDQFVPTDDEFVPQLNPVSRRSSMDGPPIGQRFSSGQNDVRSDAHLSHQPGFALESGASLLDDHVQSLPREDLVFQICCPNDKLGRIMGENGLIELLRGDIGVDVAASDI